MLCSLIGRRKALRRLLYGVLRERIVVKYAFYRLLHAACALVEGDASLTAPEERVAKQTLFTRHYLRVRSWETP